MNKMLKKLSNRNIDNMKDLDKLVDKDEIYKYDQILIKNKKVAFNTQLFLCNKSQYYVNFSPKKRQTPFWTEPVKTDNRKKEPPMV